MPVEQQFAADLARIPSLSVRENAPLSELTRFQIGGPAAMLAETADENAFAEAMRAIRASRLPYTVIGGGSNLIVSDSGFPGVVLRYTGNQIHAQGMRVSAGSGAVLQDVVDFTIAHGLKGLETMTGIPGWLGGAVYGNAGAYGHSIMEIVDRVRFFDGQRVREVDNAGCQFLYRESIFKRNKDWVIFSADLAMRAGESDELRAKANGIRQVRDEKYPPTMKCAGSIFKNLIVAELAPHVREVIPAAVIREGKAPSAWFLEQVNAKGYRVGGIWVADYHANLIYNADGGNARQVCEVIQELKQRVRARFDLELQEEVQYIGFSCGSF